MRIPKRTEAPPSADRPRPNGSIRQIRPIGGSKEKPSGGVGRQSAGGVAITPGERHKAVAFYTVCVAAAFKPACLAAESPEPVTFCHGFALS